MLRFTSSDNGLRYGHIVLTSVIVVSGAKKAIRHPKLHPRLLSGAQSHFLHPDAQAANNLAAGMCLNAISLSHLTTRNTILMRICLESGTKVRLM